MVSEWRNSDTLPSKQAVAGSSPVSLLAHQKPLRGKQAVRESASRRFYDAQKGVQRHPASFCALPHGKASFVRFKYLFSSDSELVSPPSLQHRSSALEQEKNKSSVIEKEEGYS